MLLELVAMLLVFVSMLLVLVAMLLVLLATPVTTLCSCAPFTASLELAFTRPSATLVIIRSLPAEPMLTSPLASNASVWLTASMEKLPSVLLASAELIIATDEAPKATELSPVAWEPCPTAVEFNAVA